MIFLSFSLLCLPQSIIPLHDLPLYARFSEPLTQTTMAAALPSLDVFPEEVIRVILQFVSPEDNLASIQPLSHRFHLIANEPLLWRSYCCRSWQYWHHDHMFREKLAMRATSVDWKGLWIARRRTQAEVSQLFDDMLSTRVGQLQRLKQICLKGYDAKDFLLEQCCTNEHAEDVLARRYETRSICPNGPSDRPRGGSSGHFKVQQTTSSDDHVALSAMAWQEGGRAKLTDRAPDTTGALPWTASTEASPSPPGPDTKERP